jgi:predicted membrane chloride channel (bestrophin family)
MARWRITVSVICRTLSWLTWYEGNDMSSKDFKAFWQSKTLWGVLITALPTILRVAGVPLPPVLDSVIVEVLVTATGAAMATQGRMAANPNLSFRGK